ncbi:MAG: hypothetical protein L7T84_06185 [Akkermansiaceae bacterium]|nr:hypothetical protein [Akkermansiaceae bacterium]MCH1508771.1 hypothetical protein [Akkermansiaceae bacterium]
MKKFIILLTAGAAFALASCASTGGSCCGDCSAEKKSCCGSCGGGEK